MSALSKLSKLSQGDIEMKMRNEVSTNDKENKMMEGKRGEADKRQKRERESERR